MSRPNLTETEKAYIGGLVDGEGYIGFCYHPRKDRPTQHYESKLVVDMTDEKVMRWLHSRIGGSFYVSPPKPGYRKRLTSYRVTLTRKQAAMVLEQIRPYLIVKADKADKLLKLESSRGRGKPVLSLKAQELIIGVGGY